MCTIVGVEAVHGAEGEYAERIMRAMRDPYFPAKQLTTLQDVMLAAWRRQIQRGTEAALAFDKSRTGKPTAAEADAIVRHIGAHVGSQQFIKHPMRHEATAMIAAAFQRAGREVNSEIRRIERAVRKDDLNIQIADGMSEFDAINAIADQIFIAAGDFWDTQLQDSIRAEIKSWLDGEITRDEFAAKLKTLVNTRLVSAQRDTLADSYFQRLAHHTITRTRTMGKFARMKQLGVSRYKLINPMDSRTSVICRTLVDRGTIYTVRQAQPVVDDLLSARTTAELKSTQPFWTATDAETGKRIPVPPLHWGDCRTMIVPVIL